MENIEPIIQDQLIILNCEHLFEYFCLNLQQGSNFVMRSNQLSQQNCK
jgi:hypothetical protein